MTTQTNLVKAYAATKIVNDHRIETLVVSTPEGELFITERPYSSQFEQPGTVWTKIKSLPWGVDFIGQYKRPAGI